MTAVASFPQLLHFFVLAVALSSASIFYEASSAQSQGESSDLSECRDRAKPAARLCSCFPDDTADVGLCMKLVSWLEEAPKGWGAGYPSCCPARSRGLEAGGAGPEQDNWPQGKVTT